MDACCSRVDLQASQLRFMGNGERIYPNDTSDNLGIVNKDFILVVSEHRSNGLKEEGEKLEEMAPTSRMSKSLSPLEQLLKVEMIQPNSLDVSENDHKIQSKLLSDA